MKCLPVLLVFGGLALTPTIMVAQFEHERHAALFNDCGQCHAGATTEGQPILPQPSFCAACHNGQVQPRVSWTPVQRVSTMRFTHDGHPAIGCANCHNETGASGMEVTRTVVDKCFACHNQGGSSHEGATTNVCGTCHVPTQGAARPASHGPDWTAFHGGEASAQPDRCAACHIRQDCLDCHRPSAASWSSYHPPTFLTEHPVAAYARQTSCADCHNVSQFCSSCHQQAGLVAPQDRELRRSYHDASGVFLVGHGPAARQSLESCVSCHVERDCLACHAALGPRRISPHGSSFNGDKLRGKNSQMCAVCHGPVIPGEVTNRRGR